MVKHYTPKGGHGGHRPNAGLRPGYWEERGGRAAAAEAKSAKTTATRRPREAAATKAGAPKHTLLAMFGRSKKQAEALAAEAAGAEAEARPDAADMSAVADVRTRLAWHTQHLVTDECS